METLSICMHVAASQWLATWIIVHPIQFMETIKLPLLLSIWFCLGYLFILVHMLQIRSLACCILGLGTLGWLLLYWGYWMYHFWMGTCPGKLTCLGLAILSLTLWIFCMVWCGIHISRAPWLFVWTFKFPQCVHLWRMCVDAPLIKIIVGVQINYHHCRQWWWNPCLGTWYFLCLYEILSHILLYCYMLVLTWNWFPLIFCVGKGLCLQRRNVVLFPKCGGVWKGG